MGLINVSRFREPNPQNPSFSPEGVRPEAYFRRGAENEPIVKRLRDLSLNPEELLTPYGEFKSQAAQLVYARALQRGRRLLKSYFEEQWIKRGEYHD